MKKLGYGVAILVVLLIAAVLVVPSLIDWNAYKPEIAAQVKKATGRDVILKGDLSLAILPEPHVSIADARLVNAPGASAPDMVSLKELSVHVKFAPLFQGRIEVASIDLIKPVIELEKMANGKGNWEFAPPQGAAAAPSTAPAAAASSGAPEPAPSSSSSGGGTGFSLDSLRIVDGTLIYRDAKAGTVERVDGITADASAESEKGPFSFNGKLTVRDIPLTLRANVGRFAEKGTIPVVLEVHAPAASADLSLKGTVTDAESAPKVSATVDIRGKDLASTLANVTHGAAPPVLAQPFSVVSSLDATAAAVALNDLAMTLGQTRVTGSAKAALGSPLRLDVSLKTPLIDANALAAAMAKGGGATDKAAPDKAAPAGSGRASGVGGASSGGQPAASAGAPSGPAIPKDIVANVSFTANEVAWKDSRAREATLVASLKNGVVTVDTLSAKLPGGAEFLASGKASGDRTLTYSGKVNAVASNLRATLAWLQVDPTSIAADRLRRLTLNASFQGNPQQVQISPVAVQVDATHVTGGVTLALRDRPAFGASVNIDRLDIDSYIPPKGPPANAAGADGSGGSAMDTGKPAPAKAADAGASSTTAPLAALKAFDANMVVHVGSMTYRQNVIRDVRFDGTLQNGALTIRDASVRNLAGTSAQIKGTVKGFDGIPTFKGTVAAASDNLSGLFAVAGIDPPVPPSRLGKMRLSASTDVSGDKLGLDAQLQLSALHTTVKGTATGLPLSPRFDMTLGVREQSFIRMVRMFDPAYAPRNSKLGDFGLTVAVKGDPSNVQIGKIDGHVGKTTLSGTGSVKLATARPLIDLNLDAGVVPVSDFLAAPRRADAGRPGGDRFADWIEGGKRPNPLLVRVAATAPAASSPASPRWSREKIDTAALGLVDANLTMTAKALLYDNFRVDSPKVVAALKDRVLDVSQVTGKMFDGAFDMKGKLDARSVPTATTSVTVTKANVSKLLFDAAAVDIANGILNFKMDLTTSGQSQLAMIQGLNGKGDIDVANGVVKGFDLKKASDALKNSDKVAGILGVLNTAMAGGTTPFSKLSGTFAVTKGVVRTDDLKLVADAGAGDAKGYVDLPAWNMDMLSEFRLTDHPQAPPFRVRLTGAPDEPKRIIDFKALQTWMLEQGVGSLIKKFIPQKQPSQDKSGATQNQQQDVKPADILKGLLKGLGR